MTLSIKSRSKPLCTDGSIAAIEITMTINFNGDRTNKSKNRGVV